MISDPVEYTGVDPDESTPHSDDEPVVHEITDDVLNIVPPQTAPDASEPNPTLIEPVTIEVLPDQEVTDEPQPL